MRALHSVLLLIFIVTLSACKIVAEKPRYITDDQGRALILHGLNTSSSAKQHPQRLPWVQPEDIEREATQWGFNFVRLLIFWDAIEPSPGVYDEHYLDLVAERIRWYQQQKMYVLLDMHQDLYAIQFGGDGAPDWAVITDGLSAQPRSPWWLTYLEPGVTRSFDNFWRYDGSHRYLQDHYAAMWRHVAQRFKDEPNVIGYDVMNEPYGGSLAWPLFEPVWLKPFYERVIQQIRTVDNDTWIFVEPQALGVNFGVASALPVINDSRQGEKRLVYAPHFYPPLLHEGGDYNGDLTLFKSWASARARELDNQQMPLVVGEFGISPQQKGAARFIRDVMQFADYMQAGWALWSNDPGSWSPTDQHGNETVLVDELVRIYPRAIAGKPKTYLYDANKRHFTLEFTTVKGITGPTEIYIPARRHFPEGWTLSVNVPKQFWQQSWDEQREVLSLFTHGEDIFYRVEIRSARQ